MKFLFCDIDHTVSAFLHEEGLRSLRRFLASPIGNTHKDDLDFVVYFVNLCYETFHARAKGMSYNLSIEQSLTNPASRVLNYKLASDIHWSRELWVHAAPGALLKNVSISPQFAVEAANAYWRGIEAHAHPYKDAEQFFGSSWWNNSSWQLALVTSSDARLRVERDVLTYDPEYSDRKKRERIPAPLLRTAGNNVFVGDPIGKPHPDFWHLVLADVGYEQKSTSNGYEGDIAVMIGDSYGADIKGVREWDGIPILIDRESKIVLKEVPEAKCIISSFAELPAILAKLEKERLQTK